MGWNVSALHWGDFGFVFRLFVYVSTEEGTDPHRILDSPSGPTLTPGLIVRLGTLLPLPSPLSLSHRPSSPGVLGGRRGVPSGPDSSLGPQPRRPQCLSERAGRRSSVVTVDLSEETQTHSLEDSPLHGPTLEYTIRSRFRGPSPPPPSSAKSPTHPVRTVPSRQTLLQPFRPVPSSPSSTGHPVPGPYVVSPGPTGGVRGGSGRRPGPRRT